MAFLTLLSRAVFRIQPKVYGGAFLQKQLMVFSFFRKINHYKFYIIFHNFVNSPVLKTLNKLCIIKQQLSKYNQREIYFFSIVAIYLFLISSLEKVFEWLFQTGFFSFGRPNKWSLVALDRWSSYVVTTEWEFA